MTVRPGVSSATVPRSAPSISKLAGGRVAEPNRPRRAGPGETGTLGRPLHRREHESRLIKQRVSGSRERDLTACPHEQRRTEAALQLLDLVAQRRLGDIQPRRGSAEMELLRDGQEVAKQAWLEIDSPRLSIALSPAAGRRGLAERAAAVASIVTGYCWHREEVLDADAPRPYRHRRWTFRPRRRRSWVPR